MMSTKMATKDRGCSLLLTLIAETECLPLASFVTKDTQPATLVHLHGQDINIFLMPLTNCEDIVTPGNIEISCSGETCRERNTDCSNS